MLSSIKKCALFVVSLILVFLGIYITKGYILSKLSIALLFVISISIIVIDQCSGLLILTDKKSLSLVEYCNIGVVILIGILCYVTMKSDLTSYISIIRCIGLMCIDFVLYSFILSTMVISNIYKALHKERDKYIRILNNKYDYDNVFTKYLIKKLEV